MNIHRIRWTMPRFAACLLLFLATGCVPLDIFYELRADEVYRVGYQGVREAYRGYDDGNKGRFLSGAGKYLAALEWLRASRDYHRSRGEDDAAEVFGDELSSLLGSAPYPGIDAMAAELGATPEDVEHATRVAYGDLGPVYRPLAAAGAFVDTAADHATDAAREGMTTGIVPRFTPPSAYVVPATPAAFTPALEYVPPR